MVSALEQVNVRRLVDHVKNCVQDTLESCMSDGLSAQASAFIAEENYKAIAEGLKGRGLVQDSEVKCQVAVDWLSVKHSRRPRALLILEDRSLYELREKFYGRRTARVRAKRAKRSMCFMNVFIQPIQPLNHIDIKYSVSQSEN